MTWYAPPIHAPYEPSRDAMYNVKRRYDKTQKREAVLQFLHKQKNWTADEVSVELGVSRSYAGRLLRDLEADELAEHIKIPPDKDGGVHHIWRLKK